MLSSLPPQISKLRHLELLDLSGNKLTAIRLRHKLGLKSTYAARGELPLTNYTPSFQGIIDYIWYGSGNLAVNAVLGVNGTYLRKVVGLPNFSFE